MSEQDVWIEVNEMVKGLQPFYATTATTRPLLGSYLTGTSAAVLCVKFNLTAYVKHMIAGAGSNGDRKPEAACSVVD